MKTIDAATKRRLAVAAECDPRSIDRYLQGQLRPGVVYARIDRVVTADGLLPRQMPQPNRAISVAPNTRA